MNDIWRPILMMAGLVAVMALVSAGAVAGERPKVDTTDEDFEYGQHELSEDARFDSPQLRRGPVDRREETNPLAGHAIGWPTGYIPSRGTVIIANRLVLGQRLAVSVSDDVQVFAEGYLPLRSQTYGALGGQFRVAGDDVWNLTVGLQGRGRRTNFVPGTADAGLLSHAVVDVIAGDNTSWNVGVAAYAPVFQSVEEVDYSACETRSQWAESSCGTTDQQSQFLPSSGYWASVFAGVNHFVTDWLIVNAELFTGVSQGNFWALESALDPELPYEIERDFVEDTDISAGLGPLGILTLGLGTTWKWRGVAAQTSLYFTNYRGDAQILPWFSAAYSF